MSQHKIAALYVRTSQDKDDAFSLDSQIAEGLNYAAENGIEVPTEYILREEFTGKVLDRPELNKLRKLMRLHNITAVIVYDASRLARKIGVADLMLDEIFETNVQLHLVSWGAPVKDTIRDRKTFYDESVYADIERRKIAERTTRGKRNKQAQGIWSGQGINKYGFEKTGKKRETQLYIAEEEAQAIRTIFHAFVVQRAKIGVIADFLTEQGIPTPGKAKGSWNQTRQWREHMIYSILRDEVYVGRFYFNKFASLPTDHGTITNRIRPREEWQLVEFPHLRIVEQDIWDKAQEILDSGRRVYAPPTKHQYLVSRRLKCALCNRSVSSITAVRKPPHPGLMYYVCEGRRSAQSKFKRTEKREKCQAPYIPVAKLDSIFWGWVCMLGKNPKSILAGYQRIQKEQVQQHEDGLVNIESAKRVIEKYERDLAEEYEDYRAGMIPKSIYLERKEQMDKRLAEAQATLDEFESTQNQRVITDSEIDNRVLQVTELVGLAGDLEKLEFLERRKVIELLDITGITGMKDGRVYVDIVWCGKPQDRRWIDEDEKPESVLVESENC